MSDNETDTKLGIFEGFVLLVFLLLFTSIIVFITLKWKAVSLKPNDSGGFDTITTTWWGISKDTRSYKFNENTKKWEITVDADTTLKL